MPWDLTIFGYLVLGMAGLVALLVVNRLFIRFVLRRRKPSAVNNALNTNLCKCGYPLDNLLIARCPECGRVIGFDANPEELGLSDEELRRAQAARLRRVKMGDGNCPQQDSNLRP